MGWKIYFLILTLLMIAGTALIVADSLGVLLPAGTPLLDDDWTWLDSLSILITWVGIVGLFGFAYKKVIGGQNFWKKWFIFTLVLDISYTVYDSYPEGFAIEDIWYDIIAYSLILPYYIALYLYGYKSEELWNPRPIPA